MTSLSSNEGRLPASKLLDDGTVGYLCTCLECSAVQPAARGGRSDTQTPKGRYLSPRDYTQHQRREQVRGDIEVHFPPDLRPPPPHRATVARSPPIPSLLQQSPTPPPHGRDPSLGTSPSSSPGQQEILAILKELDASQCKLIDFLGSADQIHVVFRVGPDADIPDALKNAEGTTSDEYAKVPSLDPKAPENMPVFQYRELLGKSRCLATEHKGSRSTRIRFAACNLEETVNKSERKLDDWLLVQWRRQQYIGSFRNVFNTNPFFRRPAHLMNPIVLGIYMAVITLHLIVGLSEVGANYLLRAFQTIISTLVPVATTLDQIVVDDGLCKDVRTAMKHIDLLPTYDSFVCCPKCFHLYPNTGPPGPSPTQPSTRKKDSKAKVPETCRRTFDGQKCGARLWKHKTFNGTTVPSPLREFRYHTIHQYLGRLYSQPELQKCLESTQGLTSSNLEMADIWDGSALRQLPGSDQKPFILAPPGEDRLVFSLNMDGFNPYGNRQAGKKVTVGGIYMVCLNLPPRLRYEMENMYLVGIIPGPQAPSQEEINSLLHPLVQHLIPLWKDGAFLTRTSLHPQGRLVKVAVGPLVCDLPAARQMAGFAHYMSIHFCSECTQTLPHINNIDHQNWTARTYGDHLHWAQEWKNSTTRSEREHITKTYGVRWSALLHLPYWDPTQFTAIDSMHAFFLRLFQHHCRSVWGMSVDYVDGDGVTFDKSPSHPTDEEMCRANELLRYGDDKGLGALRAPVLRELCKSTSTLDHRGNKPSLVEQLLAYRIRQGWPIATRERRSAKDSPGSDSESNVHDLESEDEGEYSELEEHGDIGEVEAPTTTGVTDLEIIGDQLPFCPFIDASQTTLPQKSKILNDQSVFKTSADVEDLFARAPKSTISKLKVADLRVMFQHMVQPTLQMLEENAKNLTKAKLEGLIAARRFELGITLEDGSLAVLKSSKKKAQKTRVLGAETLAEIRKDMRAMTQPTWVTAAPAHPGEKKWGKFTADQWRTFCLVNLPTTLIRLWGSKDPSSIERRRLENFMHLVSAVKLATHRTINASVIERYQVHIHRYLSTLLELYPNTRITPYQHLALHFGDQLSRFGPTHAWRCFAFERYNYILQNVPTNDRFGELEGTMLNRFCSAQNLRMQQNSSPVPKPIAELALLFQNAFDSDSRGTRITDVHAFDDHFKRQDEVAASWDKRKESNLNEHEYSALKGWISEHDPTATFRNVVCEKQAVERLGEVVSTDRHSSANSCIAFPDAHPTLHRPSLEQSRPWSAGKVYKLFSHAHQVGGAERVETFALVRPFQELLGKDVCGDVYSRYGEAGGRMFYNRFIANTVGLVNLDDILCQTANLVQTIEGIEEPCVSVLPLNKKPL